MGELIATRDLERRIFNLSRRITELEERVNAFIGARQALQGICYCPARGDNYHTAGDPGCVQAKDDEEKA